MAVDMFLKLTGIDGEATDAKHDKSIELQSFSWGLTQPASFGSGTGGGAGKANFQDISFSKYVDKASPNLMLACASGKHIPEGLVTVRKAGGDEALPYLTVKFTDVLITSYQVGASSGQDREMDTSSFSYAKVEANYQAQDKTGAAAGGPVPFTWDLLKNTK